MPCLIFIQWLASQFTQDNPNPAPAESHSSLPRVSHLVSQQNKVDVHDLSTSAPDSAYIHNPCDVHDPLAEFYNLAKAERDNEVFSGFFNFRSLPVTVKPSPQCSEFEADVTSDDHKSDGGETDDEYHGEAGPPVKRVWTFF
jgi:hypothetical protein